LQHIETTRGAEMLKLENRYVTVKDNVRDVKAENEKL